MVGFSSNSSALSPERLQRMVREFHVYSSASAEDTPEFMRDKECGIEDILRDDIGLNGKSQSSPLTPNVYTRMKHTWTAGISTHAAVDEGGSERCNSFHLVVDGAVFQIDAPKPKGVFRVWASVLPRVSGTSRTATVMVMQS